MGIFRKVTSVSTMGLVDFRSDKERTARYARQSRNAVRAQSKMQANVAQQQAAAAYQQAAFAQQQMRMQAAQLAGQHQQSFAPGWYPAPSGAPQLQWWDGHQWTVHTQPLPLPPGQQG